MDIYERNKLLIRLVLILVLINLCSLGFFWWQDKKGDRPGPPHKHEEVSKLLCERLQLSTDQVQQLMKIREDFYNKEKELGELLRQERDSMNLEMFSDHTDTSFVSLIARRVADNEYRMEMYRIEQAIQLQKLCTPDQLKKLNGLVKEVRDYFQPGKEPGPEGNRKVDQ